MVVPGRATRSAAAEKEGGISAKHCYVDSFVAASVLAGMCVCSVGVLLGLSCHTQLWIASRRAL